MNQDKRNIDKLFRDGLKGVREKPPVHAWDRLNHDLDLIGYKKPIVYFRWVAAVALILKPNLLNSLAVSSAAGLS